MGHLEGMCYEPGHTSVGQSWEVPALSYVNKRGSARTLSPRRACPPLQPQCPGREEPPVPFSFLVWAGVGDRELAEDTGLARSAYMSSESTLCTELLLDVALDTEETLLTLRDLDTHKHVCTHVAPMERRPVARGHGGPVTGVHVHPPQPPVSRNMFHQTGDFRGYCGRFKGAPW